MQSRNDQLDRWRILNIIRGCFFILGWIVISITPTRDRLTENLKKADENILAPTDQDGQHLDVIRSSGV